MMKGRRALPVWVQTYSRTAQICTVFSSLTPEGGRPRCSDCGPADGTYPGPIGRTTECVSPRAMSQESADPLQRTVRAGFPPMRNRPAQPAGSAPAVRAHRSAEGYPPPERPAAQRTRRRTHPRLGNPCRGNRPRPTTRRLDRRPHPHPPATSRDQDDGVLLGLVRCRWVTGAPCLGVAVTASVWIVTRCRGGP